MQLLILPYLFFKDFSQSSGVLHQAMIAKALARKGHGVTFVVPNKADGWKYDIEEYFGGFDNLNTFEADMAKDQIMWTGLWSESFIKLLSPMRTPILYDAIINMVPPMTPGIQRLLTDVGFSRFNVPVINVFDTVTVPSEQSIRRGNLPGYVDTLMMTEVMSTAAADGTFVTTASEMAYLKRNIKDVFAPGTASKVLPKLNYNPKPLILPEATLRKAPKDGVWRIFMGRSFGKDYEAGGKQGEQVIGPVKAIRNLNALGIKAKLVLCTRSPLDDWCKTLLANLDANSLELHHNATRDETLKALQSCQLAIDLRDYDGLYMAALEQQASGAVTITKSSKWAEGEIQSSHPVDTYDPVVIAVALRHVIERFEEFSPKAFETAQETRNSHLGKALADNITKAVEASMQWPGADKFKAMLPCFTDAIGEGKLDGMEFDAAVKLMLSKTTSKSLGRYARIWAMKMFRDLGYDTVSRSGPGNPSYYLEER